MALAAFKVKNLPAECGSVGMSATLCMPTMLAASGPVYSSIYG